MTNPDTSGFLNRTALLCWNNATRQQTIITMLPLPEPSHADPYLCRHMASLGHNALMRYITILARWVSSPLYLYKTKQMEALEKTRHRTLGIRWNTLDHIGISQAKYVISRRATSNLVIACAANSVIIYYIRYMCYVFHCIKTKVVHGFLCLASVRI